jgi:hypothetical protein
VDQVLDQLREENQVENGGHDNRDPGEGAVLDDVLEPLSQTSPGAPDLSPRMTALACDEAVGSFCELHPAGEPGSRFEEQAAVWVPLALAAARVIHARSSRLRGGRDAGAGRRASGEEI